MNISVKALTFFLAAILIVFFSNDALAQRGRGGPGLGNGPGGGVGCAKPGSAECVNACPYPCNAKANNRAVRVKADTVRGQKSYTNNRPFYGRYFARGNSWR